MGFSGYRPFRVFSNLSYSTSIFSSAQAVFTSLPIFLFCFVSITWPCPWPILVLVPTSLRSLVLKIPASVPGLLPMQFYSRLINLFFLKLPLSDVDSNEEGMRAGKNTFLPSFLKLLRHIKGAIIGNDMLSSSLRLPVLNIRTTDEIYKEINCKLFNEEYQMITITNGCAFL